MAGVVRPADCEPDEGLRREIMLVLGEWRLEVSFGVGDCNAERRTSIRRVKSKVWYGTVCSGKLWVTVE